MKRNPTSMLALCAAMACMQGAFAQSLPPPGLGVLPRLALGQHALGRRRVLRDAAARVQGRQVQAAAADRRPHARFAHRVLLRLHDEFARHDHADPGCRFAVPDGFPRCRRRSVRRREDLQGDLAQGHSGACVLVLHGVRQPVAVDARYAAALSAGRQPELPIASGHRGGRRLDDHLLLAAAAGRRGPRQLDPDCSAQGLVHDPAALQPAAVVLRQELAAERGRTGEAAWNKWSSA